MKKLLLLNILFLRFYLSDAQVQISPFVMSSVAAMPNTYSNGLAIQFKSITTCLDVQNGIAVLSGSRGDGQFAINCEVTMKFNSLGIKMYPNPVEHQTKLKFTNTPPLNELFNISIWTSTGVMVRTQKETGYNLFQGLLIDLSNLQTGTYVLKLESANFIDAVKFIKAN